MGRRSSFKRRYMDDYATPVEAVEPLVPWLHAQGVRRFCEPCRGDGYLVDHLEGAGLRCGFAGDIRMGWDALEMTPEWFAGIEVDAIITNPPWSAALRLPLIDHFLAITDKPVWLLLDAEAMHTLRMIPYMPRCSDIVSIGRVRWIAGSRFQSLDSACWYRFQRDHVDGPRFRWRAEAVTA